MTTNTDALNSMLRGEISATETYTQAMETFAGQASEAELRRIRDEHRESANALRKHVHSHGAQPDQGSGAWGAWAKVVEGTAKVFGAAAALKALKEGEEAGIGEYESAIKDKNLAPDCVTLVREKLLPECRARVQALNRLIA
jgi:hypothetical protein